MNHLTAAWQRLASVDVTMTPWQADEVRGLLDVVADDIQNGDREGTWGEIQGLTLQVLDPAEAIEDLEWRADSLVLEADTPAQGQSHARSLRLLADKIRGLDKTSVRKTASVDVEPRSLLPYDRYSVNERLVIKEGSGYHPDADLDKAKAKQQASYDKWRAANPGRKRPDRYKPENASSWTSDYHYFTSENTTPGTVAFLDCEVRGDYIRIAYGEVRRDKRGKGLMRELLQALYDRHPDATVSWGKLMAPEMGALYRSFQTKYPDRTTGGSVYY